MSLPTGSVVVIDPGHGGHDPGAVHAGVRESDINLAVSQKLADYLVDFGLLPILTRYDDRFAHLAMRVDRANTLRAALLVSIHCNAFADPSAHGFEVFTSPGQTKSDAFATSIYDAYAPLGRKARVDFSDGDPDKESGLYVLRKTVCPAVLVELEFLSHADGRAFLLTEQGKIARAIATGIAVGEVP